MNKIKVLMTQSHLEAHDRGVKYTSKKLMEAGMEVIYTKFRMVNEIYTVAIQEDVDIIGISCSSTNPLRIITDLTELLSKHQSNFSIILGGVIPSVDIPKLKEMGVKAVFGPGSAPREIVEFVEKLTEF